MTKVARSLVVTADDFGLSHEVNDAVEIAHRTGILTAASLMVAEPALDDAVRRARSMPGLAVGLHLALVDARPLLTPREVPDLVGPDGRFRSDLAPYGAQIFFRPAMKRQVAAEIRAQFEAYRRTGLPLDHVDAHKHYHLHPTVAALLIAIGREYGMRALRVPVEPLAPLRAVEPVSRGLEARIAAPYARWLRGRGEAAGLAVADHVFGLAWSGAMTRDRVLGLLEALPSGRIEIYGHPAVAGGFGGEASGYRYAEELVGLTDPAVIEAARAIERSSYAAWAAAG